MSIFSDHIDQVRTGAAWLKKNIEVIPEIAIITGSAGPLKLFDHFTSGNPLLNEGWTDYPIPPGLPKPTLKGHKAKMVVGSINGTSVVLVMGRVHFNECPEDPYRHIAMVRALGLFGIKNIILTNAVGSLKPHCKPGAVCVIADHNSKFMGHSPLSGDANLIREVLGADFHTGMNPVYDARFQELAMLGKYDGSIRSGTTSLMVPGPEFESASEAEMFAPLADVVGMSSIPEAMAARQLGMRVLMLSLVTNRILTRVALDSELMVSHAGNLNVAETKDATFAVYLAELVGIIGKDLRGELVANKPGGRMPVSDEQR